jgi:hypothetical protein
MKVIFISYWSGVDGSVTSEWAEDKMRALEQLGHSIVLITSIASALRSSPSRFVTKVPSLSWREFSSELVGLSTKSGSGESDLVGLGLGFWKMFTRTLGRLYDYLFRILAGSDSDGRYSWFFAAAPFAIWHAARNSGSMIFSTGGPSVAHIVALTASKLTGRALYSELQDPLIGSEMQLSRQSRKVLEKFERALAKNAKRLVLVTQTAAKAAIDRNREFANHIECIYPGAYDFNIGKREVKPISEGLGGNPIVFAHLGHLYGSRNLDLVFRVVDQLVAEGEISAGQLKIWNLGPAYVQNHSDYLGREDYRQFPLSGREDGLKLAALADFLLLVQHSDSRSQETIPYKTYDYLNLGMPVIGIVDNPELRSLLGERGIIGSCTNLEETKFAIKRAFEIHRSGETTNKNTKSPLLLTEQVAKIFRP